MPLHHSEETHRQLLARVPEVTGRPISEWKKLLDNGPGLSRVDERVTWLAGEYSLAPQYAATIVHECELQRAHRSFL